MWNARILWVCMLLSFTITGCQYSLFHNRHHAHRDYIRIGKHQEAKESMESPVNTTSLSGAPVQVNQSTPIKDSAIVTGSNRKPTYHQTIISNRDIKGAPATKPAFKTGHANKQLKKYEPKHAHQPKESSALNIIGLAAAILALVGFFAAGIILLFSFITATLLMPGITMLWICFGLALVGMVLGALGVGLKHPGKGMGVAALVIGSIILFSVFLIVILIAVI